MYDIRENFCARSVQEALSLLQCHPDATIVCGGTDIMIRMKERKLRNAILIRIADLQELQGIRLDSDGNIHIGPATCFDSIYRDQLIRSQIPMLSDACNLVGSPQIRKVATIGGNLCNGAVSADSVPALLTLNAELTLVNSNGERVVPICNFHTGPGYTVLDAERELLVDICIRKEDYAGFGGHYIKFGQRRAMEISTLGCAVNCCMHPDGTLGDFRIAFGVAGPKPCRCPKAEERMLHERPSKALLSMLRQAVLEETQPRDSWRASKELRVQLIKELSVRVATCAIIKAGGVIND